MSTLAISQSNLPTALEDLSKFVLVGRDKMIAVRAEIRAIDKLGLAEEVRRQKLDEAQMISEAVLDAEVKIGALTALMPKASGMRTDMQPPDTAVVRLDKPKSDAIRELGFTTKQVERYEKLAQHPDIVEQAKAEARERDDIVSRSFVLQKIDEAAKPHVANNSGNNEWYTPVEYLVAARVVLGSIDLDPASSAMANRTVRATTFYTAEDNGLDKQWVGRVWMNPPYSADLISQFADKLKLHVQRGDVPEAIVLVNNATETAWFNTLIGIASAVVFPRARIKYLTPDAKVLGTPLQGQAFIYIGKNANRFLETFGSYGWGARVT